MPDLELELDIIAAWQYSTAYRTHNTWYFCEFRISNCSTPALSRKSTDQLSQPKAIYFSVFMRNRFHWQVNLARSNVVVQIWLLPIFFTISFPNWRGPWKVFISCQTIKSRQVWSPSPKVGRQNSALAEWRSSSPVDKNASKVTAIILKNKYGVLYLINCNFIFFFLDYVFLDTGECALIISRPSYL